MGRQDPEPGGHAPRDIDKYHDGYVLQVVHAPSPADPYRLCMAAGRSDAPETWAAFLRAARKAKGLTQEELAEQAGVGRQTIIRWEKGDRGTDPDTLRKVADILGVPYAAALTLTHGADDVDLPQLLPRAVTELVDLYNVMSEADRELLLERVLWVVDWGRMHHDANQAKARRRAG